MTGIMMARLSSFSGGFFSTSASFQSIVTNSTVYGLAWNGSTYVATAYLSGSTFFFLTSPDGITWTSRTNPTGGGVVYPFVIWGGSLFIALGEGGGFSTSSDGITWTAAGAMASGGRTINSVVWNGSKYVAVGQYGNCFTSTNGTTWTSQAGLSSVVPATTNMRSVIWNGSLFVAVGGIYATSGACATSPDGVTWTLRSSFNTAFPNQADCVVWNGSTYVAVGVDGLCATSTDAITWTVQASFATAFPSTRAYSVTWNGTAFWAVGDASGTPYKTGSASSPDGVTWTRDFSLSDALAQGGYPASSYCQTIITGGGSRMLTCGGGGGAYAYSK